MDEQITHDTSLSALLDRLASFDENPAKEPAWAEFFYYFRAGDALGQIALCDVFNPNDPKAAAEAETLWAIASEAIGDQYQLAAFYAELREAIRAGCYIGITPEVTTKESQAFVAGACHAIREWNIEN